MHEEPGMIFRTCCYTGWKVKGSKSKQDENKSENGDGS